MYMNIYHHVDLCIRTQIYSQSDMEVLYIIIYDYISMYTNYACICLVM